MVSRELSVVSRITSSRCDKIAYNIFKILKCWQFLGGWMLKWTAELLLFTACLGHFEKGGQQQPSSACLKKRRKRKAINTSLENKISKLFNTCPAYQNKFVSVNIINFCHVFRFLNLSSDLFAFLLKETRRAPNKADGREIVIFRRCKAAEICFWIYNLFPVSWVSCRLFAAKMRTRAFFFFAEYFSSLLTPKNLHTTQ